jgi:hypothetical protein
MKAFHDKLSEALYREIPDTSSASYKVMLHIDQFDLWGRATSRPGWKTGTATL